MLVGMLTIGCNGSSTSRAWSAACAPTPC